MDGKPFFSIGGQLNNSSTYHLGDYLYALDAALDMGMNTVAAPIYWECLEPECGKYDFSQVEMVISEAEKKGLKVTLLWFGTWKNGTSRFVPEWVKLDGETYRTCIKKGGVKSYILSPVCEATKAKDAAAFAQLMAYVEKRNGNGTVLAVQVENEPGFLGTVRDYSPEAEALYQAEVPAELMEWLQGWADENACCCVSSSIGRVYESWKAAGGKVGGSWPETFGRDAQEMFSAWLVSRYVDTVAAAGKAVSKVPLYANVWLREQILRRPGTDYPSGGAVSSTLDLWKKFAPHLDCIAPDIYIADRQGYLEQCDIYKRPDNILYIPESGGHGMNARYLFEAIAEYELTSLHIFAIDSIYDGDGFLRPNAAEFKDAVAVLNSLKPMLEKYQGTGRFYAVGKYEGMATQFIDFGDYLGRVCFYQMNGDNHMRHLDPHHYEVEYVDQLGYGLIIYEGDGTFYVAGKGFRLELFKKEDLDVMNDALWTEFTATRNLPYLRVDEGRMLDDGTFEITRRRNGDETDFGVWVTPDVGLVRAKLF